MIQKVKGNQCKFSQQNNILKFSLNPLHKYSLFEMKLVQQITVR